MPAQSFKVNVDQQGITIPHLTDGLNTRLRGDLIGDEEISLGDNIKVEGRALISDSGFTEFMGVVRGIPRRVFQFFKSTGASETVLVTDATFYKRASDQWQYVSNGTDTTLTAGADSPDTTITVASITGFADGDFIGINLDDGDQHQTTINGAPSGSTITLTDAMPGPAAIGKMVMKAAVLAGTSDNAVSMELLLSQDWLVFTNGIDAVQKYDGTTVEALGGLSAINVDSCRWLMHFEGYLLLFNTTESGSIKPQRARWCDTAAYETWSGGNSGFEDMLDTDSKILCAHRLGNDIAVYLDDSIQRGVFLNLEDKIFSFQIAVGHDGALSAASVQPIRDYHLVFGQLDIYRYRGGLDLEPIGTNVADAVFGVNGEIVPTYKNRSFSAISPDFREAWLFYPIGSATNPNTILRLDLRTGSFFRRTLPYEFAGSGEYLLDASRTWNDLVGTWPQQTWHWNSVIILANAPTPLWCCVSPLQVFEYGTISVDDDGTAITWFFDTKDFLSPFRDSRIDFVEFFARGDTVSIEYSADRGESWHTYKKDFALSGKQQRFQAFKQVVTNVIRWRMRGTGPGFALNDFSFIFTDDSEFADVST